MTSEVRHKDNKELSALTIAYCVPVMNRKCDLEETLAHNLEVVARFEDQVRLIVGCFDQTPECVEWIRAEFRRPLAAGHLELRELAPLPHWHFSWAKNAFGPDFPAQYYSSLDGDNFLSEEDVDHTLGVIEEFPDGVLIHHFSGQWGDGSSGRITLPADLYCRHGYEDRILPRQYDETGLIQAILMRYPQLPFVCRPGTNIFAARWIREFLARNNVEPQVFARDLGQVPAPANPKGRDYVEKTPELYYFQNINAAYTGWINSRREGARNWFEQELVEWQQRYSEKELCAEYIDQMFAGPGLVNLRRTSEITLYAVNHNNFVWLQPWVDHYRSLGVERFVVVDDHSDTPLEHYIDDPDVFIVRPEYGSFKVSKWFWIKALMAAAQEEGSWVLTTDIDEFLDVPEGIGNETPLETLILRALSSDWESLPGLLIDMMPDPRVTEVAEHEALERMTWHLWRPENNKCGYHDYHAVQWAFGNLWPLSFAVDVRHRLFGTFDCLRKIPMFQYDASVRINQGFHALGRHGFPEQRDVLLALEKPLLLMRHYKMAKFFKAEQSTMARFDRQSSYFDRSRVNMLRMESANDEWVQALWRLTPYKRPYESTREQLSDTCIEEVIQLIPAGSNRQSSS